MLAELTVRRRFRARVAREGAMRMLAIVVVVVGTEGRVRGQLKVVV